MANRSASNDPIGGESDRGDAPITPTDTNSESESPMDSTVASVEKLGIQQLIDHYHADAYRYAFRLSGSSNEAEDLTQETFLIAQQKLDQLRDPSRGRSWLFAILRSCFLRNLRKNRPVNESSIQMTVDEIPEASFENHQVDKIVLREAIADLPVDFKVVLLMFYFENYSYKEIAEKLGIKIGTVMSRLSRAKGIVRNVIFDEPAKKQ